jgi:hypothetical protein
MSFSQMIDETRRRRQHGRLDFYRRITGTAVPRRRSQHDSISPGMISEYSGNLFRRPLCESPIV